LYIESNVTCVHSWLPLRCSLTLTYYP
jgi:hypothetical protein